MQLENSNAIARHYDEVYISPHFDDAAVSCGGRIIDQTAKGRSAMVVSVFTGLADAEKPLRGKSHRTVFQYHQRRLEDQAAMTELGVDFIWLEYKDIIFRNHRPLSRYWPCYDNMPANEALRARVAFDLESICRATGCETLVLPLGVGQHVDHQIVFQAGIDVLRSQRRPPRVTFYEDCPYALFPNLLHYRMKITGGYHHLPPLEKARLKYSNPSTVKDAVDLLAGEPALTPKSVFCRSAGLFFILVLSFCTRHLVKTCESIFGRGKRLLPEVYDISRVIEQKLDVIMTYQSQLSGPVLQRKRIRQALEAYCQSSSLPRNDFCERYWRVKSEDPSDYS